MEKKRSVPNYILRVVREKDKEKLKRKTVKYMRKRADASAGPNLNLLKKPRIAKKPGALAGELSIFPKSRSSVGGKVNLKGIYSHPGGLTGKLKYKTPSAIKGALKTTGKVVGGGMTALWIGSSAKKILNYGSHKPF